MPRRVNGQLVTLPKRVRTQCGRRGRSWPIAAPTWWWASVLTSPLPAYLAARSRAPSWCTRRTRRLDWPIGWAPVSPSFVAETTPGSLPGAELVGLPLRPAIAEPIVPSSVPRPAGSSACRMTPGALRLRRLSRGAADQRRGGLGDARLARQGVSVLRGRGQECRSTSHRSDPGYVALEYVDRMDLAYAAADLALCRAGAMTVAELSAVGLFAIRAAAGGQRRTTAQCRSGHRCWRRSGDRRRRPHGRPAGSIRWCRSSGSGPAGHHVGGGVVAGDGAAERLVKMTPEAAAGGSA